MRRTCNPSLVENGQHHLLQRVNYSDRRVAEDFLQSALDKNPQVLPVEELDPSFAPLVSLGREIASIDNLFISPNGRITVVETKLWRNPEAAREVVGQILDYATRLTSWSYSEFEMAIRNGIQPISMGSDRLYEYIAKKHPSEILPEAQFVDEVQRNLRTGRFLLLVVGDGIRENIERMIGQLQRYPQMLFTFGLVEIQIYEDSSLFNGRLLFPMLVAHTTEVVRAVVRVHTTGQAQVSVEIESAAEKSPPGRRTLSEEVFFEEVKDPSTRDLFKRLLAFAEEIGAVPIWRSSSVSIQLPDPNGSKQNLTLFVLTTAGRIYTGWLASQLERINLDKNMAYDFVKSICSLFQGVQPDKKGPDWLTRNLGANEVIEKADDFMALVKETADRISASAHGTNPR
jgi:hypothetical protein